MTAETRAGKSFENVEELLRHHDRFLAFLRPRVGSSEVAEEILQAAYVKGLERSGAIRDDEAVIGWFKRLLRNALIDHYRHRDAERRSVDRFAAESGEDAAELETELDGAVCACVNALIPTLKREYADVLTRVELEGQSVLDAAAALGVTPNNAGVRLHRAREALRARLVETCGACTEHACVECSCRPRASANRT